MRWPIWHEAAQVIGGRGPPLRPPVGQQAVGRSDGLSGELGSRRKTAEKDGENEKSSCPTGELAAPSPNVLLADPEAG